MTQIVDFGRPKLNGIAPGLVAGQLLGASQLSELFLRRVSPALVDGKAELDEIRGKSIVWNQLVTTSPDEQSNADADTRATDTFYLTAQGETPQALTITTASAVGRHSEIITAAFTASSADIIISGQAVNTDIASLNNLVAGHKYYFAITVTANDITTAGGYKWKDTMFVDLTLMFGAGNEPSTVAQFEALYPDAYYPYTPGIIKNNDAVALLSESEDQEKQSTLRLGLNALRVPSHNIWDEEWEVGEISSTTGLDVEDNTVIRSKNYCEIDDNKTYYVKSVVPPRFRFYDIDKQYIGYVDRDGNGINSSREFVPPVGARYFRIAPDTTTYHNDICINLSDAAFNGLYEPYGEDGVRTVEGLDGVGTAYDSAKGYKLIKRMWEVDLGDLSWSYVSGRFVTSSLVGLIAEPDNGIAPNAICQKYLPVGYTNIDSNDKAFTVIFPSSAYHGQLWFKDSAYTDAATFKAAMAGVKFRFELATPLEYDIIGGLPGKVFDAFAGGSESIVSPEDAETPSAPFIGEFSYPESAVRGVITEEVFKEFLDALGTAMGGTWTMTYDAATKTYSFSFTS